MSENRVIVVGAGAAGLMAAGQAALAGAKVTILEKMRTPGRKLRITGKGRCNLTNTAELGDFMARFGRNGRFLRQAFNAFSPADLLKFLGSIDVPTVTERGGRVFPVSDDARDVTERLVGWVRMTGASIKTSAAVGSLMTEDGAMKGLCTVDGNQHNAETVIIATGGASYPATGSTGDGCRLAEAVGHTVVPLRPALVPIDTAGDTAPSLAGLSLQNVTAQLIVDGKRQDQEFGEMLFTHTGLSGPIILSLSRLVVDALRDEKHVDVSIDLKPALDEQKLDARLQRDIQEHGKKTFANILSGLLPRKLIPVCIDAVAIPADRTANQITADQRRRLRLWLKDFRLEVTGHRTFDEAIITAGGVDTSEIDPRTMQSRLVKGLYFAGEVIDIDADTGGYNLQAAFSTGWMAGQAAAGL